MTTFPTHPIEIHKMFKSTKMHIVNPEIENGLYFIKIHVSKVKNTNDLQNAFNAVKGCALKNGFTIELNARNVVKNFSDFRFHGSYYEIYFNVV